MKAGISLHMPQTVDPVAHNQTHGARVVIWPYAFGPMPLLGSNEVFGDDIKCRVPSDAFELAGPLGASAPERMQDPLRMVFPLGVARNFRADHTGSVIVVRRAMHTSDRALVKQFDIERTSRRAIMWTGRMTDPLCTWEPDCLIHALPL